MPRPKKRSAASTSSPGEPRPAESSRLLSHLWWAVPLLAGAVFSIPHLTHPFWRDEIVTEIFFSQSPARALTDYFEPNNHILFSLMWWLFRQVVEEPGYWRLLPFAFFLASIVFLTLAGKHVTGSRAGGWLIGMIYATAHPPVSFGTELRGYSPSLAFVAVALYAVARWRECRGGRWLALYAAMAFLAVGTVPVNLAAFAPMAVWVWCEFRPPRTAPVSAGKIRAFLRRLFVRPWAGWKAASWFALTPLAGLAFLIPVRHQLRDAAQYGSSMWKVSFLWHFPYATVFDFLWLVLAALLVHWRLAPGSEGAGLEGRGDLAVDGVSPPLPAGRSDAFAVLLISVGVPIACALAVPRTPNDYTMIAATPMIYFGLGWWTHALLRAPLSAMPEGIRRLSFFALGAVLIGAGAWREKHADDWRKPAGHPLSLASKWLGGVAGNTAGYNLYRQRFQNNADAIDVVEAIDRAVLEGMEGIPEQRPSIFVLIEGIDSIVVWQYWEWRKSHLYPDSTVGMAFRITPDDLDTVRSQWDRASRRFFVNPSDRWTRILSDSDSGILWLHYGNLDFALVEWLPADAPRPPGQ